MPRCPTVRACFTLRKSQVAALKCLHQQTGITAAEAVRRALDSFLVDRVTGYVPGPLRSAPDDNESGLLVSTRID